MKILTKQDALRKIGAYRKHRKDHEPKSVYFSPEALKALGATEKGLRVLLGRDEHGTLTLIGAAANADVEADPDADVLYGAAPSCPPHCGPVIPTVPPDLP